MYVRASELGLLGSCSPEVTPNAHLKYVHLGLPMSHYSSRVLHMFASQAWASNLLMLFFHLRHRKNTSSYWHLKVPR